MPRGHWGRGVASAAAHAHDASPVSWSHVCCCCYTRTRPTATTCWRRCASSASRRARWMPVWSTVSCAMEEAGWVSSQWDTAGSGPPRRVYTVTLDGEEYLAAWINDLRSPATRLTSSSRPTHGKAGQGNGGNGSDGRTNRQQATGARARGPGANLHRPTNLPIMEALMRIAVSTETERRPGRAGRGPLRALPVLHPGRPGRGADPGRSVVANPYFLAHEPGQVPHLSTAKTSMSC